MRRSLGITVGVIAAAVFLSTHDHAAGQDRAGLRQPHEKWSNSLKPRGVPGPQLTLASGGKALYSILLPAAPTGQDIKAAEDLAQHLQQITDAEFAIVREDAQAQRLAKCISIGRTKLLAKSGIPEESTDLSLDGYAIAVKEEDLFLLGGRRRGPIHAVYCLLEEDLGCRWYDGSEQNIDKDVFRSTPRSAPNTRRAVIPRLPELTFQPVPRAYVPQFEEMRWILVWEAKSVLFSLRNRSLSCDMIHKFPLEWGGIDSPSAIHSLPHMIPPEKYFDEHPEYFSMIDGKRNPVQICPSNPDVVRMLTRQAKEMVVHAVDNPVPAHDCPVHKFDNVQNNVALTPRDGPEYCQCPECQALIDQEGTPAAPLLNMINQVAEEVARTHPEKRIWFLAYQTTAKPPKTIRPRDNVIIWLCADSHGFGPATMYLTETPRFIPYLKGWDALGAKIVIWEYVTNFGTGMHLSPLPNMQVVGRDLQYLAGYKSVAGILLQGCLWSRGDRGRQRAWVWAKQTWDPSRDTQELIADFNYGYYGKAAEPVQRYSELLRTLWNKWHKSFETLDKKWGAQPRKTDQFITQASAYFDEAERLADGDPVLLSRLEDARLPVLYQNLLNGMARAEDRDNPLPADDPYWKTVDRLRDYCNRWQTSLFGRYDALARAEAARKGDEDRSLEQMLDTEYGRVWIQTLPPKWRFATDPNKKGIAEKWFATDYNDENWGTIRTDLGADWRAQGYNDADSDAFGWYRMETYVPDHTNPWRGENWYVCFEAIDGDADVYINGKKAFEHSCDSTGLEPEQIWETPFVFKANGLLTPAGNNKFVVGVYNRKMLAGIWKPVHIISTEADLDTEAILALLKR